MKPEVAHSRTRYNDSCAERNVKPKSLTEVLGTHNGWTGRNVKRGPWQIRG